MREILFRGKDSDGKWHEGYYVCLNGKSHRIYTGYAETDCGDMYPDWYTVDPETVGQYTGLTDKNGNKIFEGDVVERQICDYRYFNYTVNFSFGEFELQEIKTKGKMFIGYHNECEIIGNIYDNPELLEKKYEKH